MVIPYWTNNFATESGEFIRICKIRTPVVVLIYSGLSVTLSQNLKLAWNHHYQIREYNILGWIQPWIHNIQLSVKALDTVDCADCVFHIFYWLGSGCAENLCWRLSLIKLSRWLSTVAWEWIVIDKTQTVHRNGCGLAVSDCLVSKEGKARSRMFSQWVPDISYFRGVPRRQECTNTKWGVTSWSAASNQGKQSGLANKKAREELDIVPLKPRTNPVMIRAMNEMNDGYTRAKIV